MRQRNVGTYEYSRDGIYVYWRGSVDLPDGTRKRIRSTRIDTRSYPKRYEAEMAAERDWQAKIKRLLDIEVMSDLDKPIETVMYDDRPIIDLLNEYAKRETYRRSNTELAPSSINMYRQQAIMFEKHNGKITVNQFTVAHALKYKRGLDKNLNDGEPYAPTYVDIHMDYLRAAFRWAYRSMPRKISTNVLSDDNVSDEIRIELFTPMIHRDSVTNDGVNVIRRYTRDEVMAITADETYDDLYVTRKYPSGRTIQLPRYFGRQEQQPWTRQHVKLMIRLMFETGLRIGETLGLTWDKIKWGEYDNAEADPTQIHVKYQAIDINGSMQFAQLKTKYSERFVALDEQTNELLNSHAVQWRMDAEQQQQNKQAWYKWNLVFPSFNGDPRDRQSFNHWLEERCKKVGVKYKASHALRRGFATERWGKGMTRDELVLALGHHPNSDVWSLYADLNAETSKKRVTDAILRTAAN